MFGGKYPNPLSYKNNMGNDIVNATLLKWAYFIREDKDNEEDLFDFEEALEKFVRGY